MKKTSKPGVIIRLKSGQIVNAACPTARLAEAMRHLLNKENCAKLSDAPVALGGITYTVVGFAAPEPRRKERLV